MDDAVSINEIEANTTVKNETTGDYKLPHYALDKKIPSPSLSIVAREVMSGEWGQGDARDKKLVEHGHDLDEVYDKIDKMYGARALPFTNYDVVIAVPSLHVRQGPSFDHYVVTTLIEDCTRYTIVEEEIDSDSNVWGALRSGLGWINLEFTKRIEG
jgi:Cpl-7 lysozyme C-terminal domain.